MPRTGLNFDFLCVGGEAGVETRGFYVYCTSSVVEDLFDWRDLG